MQMLINNLWKKKTITKIRPQNFFNLNFLLQRNQVKKQNQRFFAVCIFAYYECPNNTCYR